MTIKVSVIIPVYNTENYLEKCLDSVINQTLDDIEIICINDGSTDNSLKILEKYAQKDDRIVLIDKKNTGLGASRNLGMEYATGKYIGFVDSDDWISHLMFEKLYENAIKFDNELVMCPINVVDEYSKTTRYDISYYTLDCFETFSKDVFTHFDVKNFFFKISVMAFNKLYKTSFLKDINAFFPEGLIFEDNPFFYKIFLNANRVSIIYEYLYYYRFNRNDSIINNCNEKYLDIINIHKISIETFKNAGVFNFYKMNLMEYIINSCLNRYKMLNSSLKYEFFNLLKDFVNTFNLSNNELNELYKTTKLKNIHISKNYKEFDLRNVFDKEISELKLENKNIKYEYSKIKKSLKKEKNKNKNIKNSCLNYKLKKFFNIKNLYHKIKYLYVFN